jgi:GTPase
LCVLVDLAALDGTSAAEQERILLYELGAYRPELLERPRLVVGSKADIIGRDELTDELRATWPDRVMSAVTGDGVRAVVGELLTLVRNARANEPEREPFVILRPLAEGVLVERVEEHEYRVKGRQAERAVALNDLTDPDAMAYVDGRLKRLGVDRALVRAGAQAGDVVWVGAFSFEYQPD